MVGGGSGRQEVRNPAGRKREDISTRMSDRFSCSIYNL